MGTWTYAILLGVEHPKDVSLWEDTDEHDSLMEQHSQHLVRETGKMPWDKEVLERQPASPYQSSVPLIGFYIATGLPSRRQTALLDCVQLAEIESRYAEQIATAKSRWKDFAGWCKEHGVDLPEPSLWLTTTEV